MSEKLNEKLSLSKDTPEFGGGYDKKRDAFDHNIYAETLYKIIRDNEPPLSIGFLGPWGYGKSTVLTLLQKQLKNEYGIVYFNAWKYSNDSFRRQFLLETVESLVSDEKVKADFKKSIRLRFFKDTEESVDSLKGLLKDFFQTAQIVRDYKNLLPVGIAVVILIFLSWLFDNNVAKSLVAGIIGAVVVFAIDRFSKILQINIPVEVNPQLVLPEQFNEEFCSILSLIKNKGSRKTIFIIDDIDRCPPDTILEILDASKTFLANSASGNYFIFALDDKSVTTILHDHRSKSYKNEDVFKFFDVTLRLNPISAADLMEFSKQIAKANSVNDEIVDIALYAGFDTPRKLKHFLNAYKVVFDIVQTRKALGIFDVKMEDVERPLAKMLALQIEFPEEFEKLKENPGIMSQWESVAQNTCDTFRLSADDEKMLGKLSEKFLKFVWTTNSIKILDIEGFLHLKIPTYAINLPYTELRDSILNKNLSQIESLLPKIDASKNTDNLIDLLLDLLGKTQTQIQLGNVLVSSIEIYKKFSADQKKRVSSQLCVKMGNYREILNCKSEDVFTIFSDAGVKNLDKIIELGVADLFRSPDVNNAAEFIEILYKNGMIAQQAGKLNSMLQSIFAKNPTWVVELLSAMPAIKNWKDIKTPVPSKEVLIPSFGALSANNADVVYSTKIINALFKFWNDEYSQPLTKWIHQRLIKLQPIGENTPEVALVLTAIEDMPAWLSAELSPDISTYLFNRYQSAPQLEQKLNLLKAYSIALYSAKLDSSQAANHAVANLDAVNLEKYLGVVSKFKDQPLDWWKTLFNQITTNILTNARTNPAQLWAQKFAVIWKYSEVQAAESAIKAILTSVLSIQQINVLTYWEDNIVNIAKSKNYNPVVHDLIKNILGADTSLENKTKVFEYYKKIISKTKKSEVGEILFDFLLKDNSNSIKFAVANISFAKEVLAKLFPAAIERYLSRLYEETNEKISQKREGLLCLLEYQDLWNTDSVILSLKIIKKLISSNSEVLLNLANAVLGRLDAQRIRKLPKDTLDDFSNALGLIPNQQHRDVMAKAFTEKIAE